MKCKPMKPVKVWIVMRPLSGMGQSPDLDCPIFFKTQTKAYDFCVQAKIDETHFPSQVEIREVRK